MKEYGAQNCRVVVRTGMMTQVESLLLNGIERRLIPFNLSVCVCVCVCVCSVVWPCFSRFSDMHVCTLIKCLRASGSTGDRQKESNGQPIHLLYI